MATKIILNLAVFTRVALANPLILDASSPEQPGFPKLEEGFVLAAPFALDDAKENVIIKSHANIKHDPDGYYIFQAFPHSRVPISSLMMIIIPVVVVLFCAFMLVLLRTWISVSDRFKFSSSAMEDREKALANLRIVGMRYEEAPQEKISPSATLTSELCEKKTDSDEKLPIGTGATRATTQSSKKVKDANEIVGPVVPVLRNEDPNVLSDGESDGSYEDEEEDELDAVPTLASAPIHQVPTYEAAPSQLEIVELPKLSTSSTLAHDSSSSQIHGLAEPIQANAFVRASATSTLFGSDAVHTQSQAHTSMTEPETKDQDSLFP
ncbi:hypothetical protein ACI68E_001111 [Malassezia pachydermatis]|uniref:Uncharacterized protein n=1 Tax=Malassezia pachydermatis TaxID=77020 RepID=A0A0M9VNB8_9BASI|nr:hypothetical protein Malapachy_1557 [Malassezia pachydermatis]KOS13189.1 hypothetical protein Malapachy_1557 [Malassezia pachydermatis]